MSKWKEVDTAECEICGEENRKSMIIELTSWRMVEICNNCIRDMYCEATIAELKRKGSK